MYRDGEASPHACTRRTLIHTSLGLGAGAALAVVGLSGCSMERKGDGDTQRVQKSDVPVGGGALVGWYVVTQPTAGTFHAYYAACPHAGVKVNRIEGQEIICDSHGARFSTDNGAVLKGPTKKSLTPAPFTTDGDVLVISMPKETE